MGTDNKKLERHDKRSKEMEGNNKKYEGRKKNHSRCIWGECGIPPKQNCFYESP